MRKDKANALEVLQNELNKKTEVQEALNREGIYLPTISEKAIDEQFRRDCVIVGLVFNDIIINRNGKLEWIGERRK